MHSPREPILTPGERQKLKFARYGHFAPPVHALGKVQYSKVNTDDRQVETKHSIK